jgi:hypothetical protein
MSDTTRDEVIQLTLRPHEAHLIAWALNLVAAQQNSDLRDQLEATTMCAVAFANLTGEGYNELQRRIQRLVLAGFTGVKYIPDGEPLSSICPHCSCEDAQCCYCGAPK